VLGTNKDRQSMQAVALALICLRSAWPHRRQENLKFVMPNAPYCLVIAPTTSPSLPWSLVCMNSIVFLSLTMTKLRW
jgi:hypothetical protein